jgi:uncharacterized protein YqeY
MHIHTKKEGAMPTLKEKLNTDKIAAIKAVGAAKGPDNSAVKYFAEVKLATIRAALAAIMEEETRGKTRKDLTDVEVTAVLRKMVKQRSDSAETYGNAGETARQLREMTEIRHLEDYLPKQLDEAATRELVSGIISSMGLEGPRAIGQVMGQLKGRTDIDTAIASRIAKELL